MQPEEIHCAQSHEAVPLIVRRLELANLRPHLVRIEGTMLADTSSLAAPLADILGAMWVAADHFNALGNDNVT